MKCTYSWSYLFGLPTKRHGPHIVPITHRARNFPLSRWQSYAAMGS
jgi:hypothetical protein